MATEPKEVKGEEVKSKELAIAPTFELASVPRSEIDRAEIDSQIATAHRFPRSISTFQSKAIAMATSDVDTAENCNYVLPRADKNIEGPSIRLAEIVGIAWGNLRYSGRVIAIEETHVVAQGICHDLESNVACSTEVRRRITNKYGKRFNDDMIGVTANAAIAIALRNSIFKIVPMVFVNPVYEAAKKAAVGNIATLEKRRMAAVDFFSKKGVPQKALYEYLGINGIEDIDLKILETMTGLKTSINDGEITVEELFPPKPLIPQRKSAKEPIQGEIIDESK